MISEKLNNPTLLLSSVVIIERFFSMGAVIRNESAKREKGVQHKVFSWSITQHNTISPTTLFLAMI